MGSGQVSSPQECQIRLTGAKRSLKPQKREWLPEEKGTSGRDGVDFEPSLKNKKDFNRSGGWGSPAQVEAEQTTLVAGWGVTGRAVDGAQVGAELTGPSWHASEFNLSCWCRRR